MLLLYLNFGSSERMFRKETDNLKSNLKNCVLGSLEYECTWIKLWGLTGVACAHRIYCLDRQEVLLATQELRNECLGFVGAELHFVATAALCRHNVKLSSFTGIPGQRSHLKNRLQNTFDLSLYNYEFNLHSLFKKKKKKSASPSRNGTE